MIWCPYIDQELPDEASTLEHIIPLALGGSNSFCIPVEKGFNSRVGSSIDGALANDFVTKMRRREFDARGHSNKPPTVILRKSVLGNDKRPVQVTLGGKEPTKVWDAMAARNLAEDEVVGQTITSQIKIGRHDRFRFLAKVALSGGHRIYGDLFRTCVRHEQLRALMNLEDSTPAAAFANFELRGYDEFTPIAESDRSGAAVEQFICESVEGSCVVAIPGPRNVGFVVGILGKWIGTLNVPASTDTFPVEGDHDLGHATLLQDGAMTTLSYRQLLQKVHEEINAQGQG